MKNLQNYDILADILQSPKIFQFQKIFLA